MHDVVIAGGGPAGSRVAALMARSHDVLVLEEHPSSGTPVQCAGLVTGDVIRMSGVSPDIINSLYGAEVVFPDGSSVIVRSKEPKAYEIDRSEFDSKMADAAMSAGAEYVYNDRVSSISIQNGHVDVLSSSGTRQCRAVVGADGHASVVSASLGDNDAREYLRGAQADVAHRMDRQDLFRIHLGSRYAPGFFTWEIPCGDFTRVGLCTSWSAGPPYQYLSRLLDDLGLSDRVQRKYNGRIPLGGRRTTYSDRCLLVGDAACQVKPVSAGGLYPGLISADILADVLTGALADDDLSSVRLSQYESRWRGALSKELDKGYRLRRMMLRMDDDDFNRAGAYAQRKNVRAELDGISLDSPSSVVTRILRHPLDALALIPVAIRCLL